LHSSIFTYIFYKCRPNNLIFQIIYEIYFQLHWKPEEDGRQKTGDGRPKTRVGTTAGRKTKSNNPAYRQAGAKYRLPFLQME